MTDQKQDISGPVRIGTRGSPLALAQAYEVRDRLVAVHPGLSLDDVEIVAIQTTGDKIQDRPLSEIGGKGLFTKEIEDGLLDGSLDLAQHCMKDMPTVLPDGLEIPVVLPRENPYDALIAPGYSSIADLPHGALVGSASLRRKSLLLSVRPDLTVINLRGNILTRVRKLQETEMTATFLACAGLNRMGMTEHISCALNEDEMLPAPGQGAIGLEVAVANARSQALIAPLNDPDSFDRVTMERAFLAALDGSCRTPIAAIAHLDGDTLYFKGCVVTPDGKQRLDTKASCPRGDAAKVGFALGVALKEKAGPEFMDQIVG
jgi:hydroxymethylbilane synthase